MDGGARHEAVSEGPRFFVDVAAVQAGRVILDGLDSHHLLRVLRASVGDRFVAVAPGGVSGEPPQAYSAELTAVEDGLAVGRILAASAAAGEPPLAVTLVQGLCKGDKMDLIVQKATELGAIAVLPVACQRSVVQLDAARGAERATRWQRIAREAAQQCRRALVPTVAPPLPWAEAARRATEFDLALVPWEEASTGTMVPGLRQRLAASPAARRIAVFIGPEGGLTAAEVDAATTAGAVVTHLGPRILRTETAGLAVLAAVLYERGDLGG